MPENQQAVSPDQALLADEVKNGQREITASVPKDAPPGYSPGDSTSSGLDDAKSAAYAQAREATSGQSRAEVVETQGPQTTEMNERGGYRTEISDPQPADTRSASAQVQGAGQSLHNSGATYDGPPLSDETKSQLQSALAKSSETSQNAPSGGSRLEAARQEAAAAPSAPAPSPSMDK